MLKLVALLLALQRQPLVCCHVSDEDSEAHPITARLLFGWLICWLDILCWVDSWYTSFVIIQSVASSACWFWTARRHFRHVWILLPIQYPIFTSHDIFYWMPYRTCIDAINSLCNTHLALHVLLQMPMVFAYWSFGSRISERHSSVYLTPVVLLIFSASFNSDNLLQSVVFVAHQLPLLIIHFKIS